MRFRPHRGLFLFEPAKLTSGRLNKRSGHAFFSFFIKIIAVNEYKNSFFFIHKVILA